VTIGSQPHRTVFFTLERILGARQRQFPFGCPDNRVAQPEEAAMLSDDARKLAGRLAVHGYTLKDGLPIDQLADYLPDLRRDQLMAAVRELEAQGCVRTLLGRSGQPEVIIRCLALGPERLASRCLPRKPPSSGMCS
jgi:hypothetical protein